MSFTTMLMRLARHWYDPDEQARREQRTANASDRVARIRQKATVSGEQVIAVRESYEQSERRARERASKRRG